ncbi:MAG: lytic transglycosylase domain-containing protein [Clostridiales bacterium]|nr:lytic transglycosylase domain-containing protein [Clostridiales bacterium]NLK22528.1 lytic transglycosylase domain-containing protein [Clostridiales bacterium]
MEINGIKDANELLQLSMMKNVLQESLGDGMEFEIVYQSLLNSLQNSTKDDNTKNILNALSKDNVTNAISTGSEILGEGTNLQKIPLKINNSNILNLISGVKGGFTGNVTTESSSETMKKIYSSVNKYASEYGVDPNLVLAVIKQESDFDPSVTSYAGAMGLMQLMPENCEEDGVSNPYDIDDNIKGGVKQLKWLLNYYNGDVSMALMGYNAGIGTVQNRGVSSASELYKMPKETQNYVPSVLSYYNSYANNN